MRYLVTGHTGFKGSWLTLMLATAGHEVIGVALDPRPGGVFEAARVADHLSADFRADIRNAAQLADIVASTRPEVVMHLAAQPLVRESYRDPITTLTTNVDGTRNLLAALNKADSVAATVIVTTDKVYRNVNQIWGYRETDPLGGSDPYSASKAMADLLAQSWAASFDGPPIAVARAGNVIGGGDISPDRLLPDLIAAYARDQKPLLRYPGAVRPWQHVLDCLNGYLALVAALLQGRGRGEWNFGPPNDSFATVADVAGVVADLMGAPRGYRLADDQPREAELLTLDSRKAEIELGWRNLISFREAIQWTVEWGPSGTRKQIDAFRSRSLQTKVGHGRPESLVTR